MTTQTEIETTTTESADDVTYAVAAIAKIFTSMHRDLMVAKAQCEATGDETSRARLVERAKAMQTTVQRLREHLGQLAS